MENIGKLIGKLRQVREIIDSCNDDELRCVFNSASTSGIDLSEYTVNRMIKQMRIYEAVYNADYELADNILNGVV